MTYYGSKELARAFRMVRNNTIGIAEDIPEAAGAHCGDDARSRADPCGGAPQHETGGG